MGERPLDGDRAGEEVGAVEDAGELVGEALEGLDLLEAHYYPELERERPLAEQLAGLGSLPAPLWLGELPASDPSAPDYSLEAALTACREAGLLGAGIWRWRPPETGGTDTAFGSLAPEVLAAWLSRGSEFRV